MGAAAVVVEIVADAVGAAVVVDHVVLAVEHHSFGNSDSTLVVEVVVGVEAGAAVD